MNELKLKKHQQHFVKNSRMFNTSIAFWPRSIGASTMLLYYLQEYKTLKIGMINATKFNYNNQTNTVVTDINVGMLENDLNKNNIELLLVDTIDVVNLKQIIKITDKLGIKSVITTLPSNYNTLYNIIDDNIYFNLLTWKDIPSIYNYDKLTFNTKIQLIKKTVGVINFNIQFDVNKSKFTGNTYNKQDKIIKFEELK